MVSPDVGGGFGYKGILLPEEVCLSWLAMQRGHPVRWIEDRREHLTASANCREHHYVITALCRSRRALARHRLRSDRRFRRLFVLSVLGVPRSGAGRQHPAGALRFCRRIAAARGRSRPTNARSCPIAASRAPASALRWKSCWMRSPAKWGWSRDEVRLQNLVRPEQMPFDNITKKHFDSGDYPRSHAPRRRGDRSGGRCARGRRAASRTAG